MHCGPGGSGTGVGVSHVLPFRPPADPQLWSRGGAGTDPPDAPADGGPGRRTGPPGPVAAQFYAHRQRAEAAGAAIITGARVHAAQRLGSGWQVGAGQEAFEAAVMVNAAGAWADELAVISGVEKLGLQPYRRTAAIVDVERSLPDAGPMVAAADDSFYFRREGADVLISPSEHVPSG